MNRLTDVNNWQTSDMTTKLSGFSYTHYADSMRRGVTEKLDENKTVKYGYDNINRLTTEAAIETDSGNDYGYNVTYEYDQSGNRTKRIESHYDGTINCYTCNWYDIGSVSSFN